MERPKRSRANRDFPFKVDVGESIEETDQFIISSEEEFDDNSDIDSSKSGCVDDSVDIEENTSSLEQTLDEWENPDEEQYGSVSQVEEYDELFENDPYIFTEDYRLIAYVNFVIREGMSDGAVDRLDSLMCVLYGENPPFMKNHVLSCINKLKKKMIVEVNYFCSKCGIQKPSKKCGCDSCDSTSVSVADSVTFVKCDLIRQVKDLLKEKGREIVAAHRLIHQNEKVFKSNDIRAYPGYQNNIESADEYNCGIVNVLCTVSSDGARFKRISRREVTPMLVRVEGLDVNSKKGGGSILLSSLAYSDGGVKTVLIDEFIHWSMDSFNKGSIDMEIDGEKILFRLVVMSYLCDMKEQHSISGLPNWFKANGCSKCVTEGVKKNRGKFAYSNPNTEKLRTNDDIRMSCVLGESGFNEDRRVPAVFSYIAPTVISVDPFHLRGMGVCKMIVEEIMKPTRWKAAKLKRGLLNTITQCIEETKCYTYDSVKMISPKKLGKVTGREIDKLAQYMSAIVGWTNSCDNVNMNVFFIGMFYSLTFMGSNLGTNDLLLKLQDKIYELLSRLEPESITMKWHVYLKHCQKHEEEFGLLHTTEVFEKEHKSFMTSVHHQTTSSELILAVRFMARRFFTSEMEVVKNHLATEVLTPYTKFVRNSTSRIPNPTSHSNKVDRSLIHPSHLELLQQMEAEEKVEIALLKRINLESEIGNFIYSAPQYWNCTNSTTSLITFFDPTSLDIHFGQIECIFSIGQSTKLLINQFLLEPFSQIIEQFDCNSLLPTAKGLLDICQQFPSCFGKVTRSQFELISSECVLCPASVTTFQDQHFIKMYR